MINNGAPRPLRLAQHSNPGRHNALGTARLVNCHSERQGDDGKVEWPIVASPGLRPYLTFPGGSCRGLFKLDETIALAVYGFDIIEIQKTGAWRVAGGIPGTTQCYFARNRKPSGAEVAIVCEGEKRVYTAGAGTAGTITDPDLPPAIDCDALSRYILFFLADGRVFYSDLNSATSISALSFFEAEGRPDGIVRGIALENNMWIYGQESTEVWGLTEDANAPFARLPGAFVEQGLLSAQSLVKVQVPSGTRLAWIANDGTVRMTSGYSGERVSEHAQERAISKAANPAAIEATAFTLDGHVHIQFSAPEFTWAYSATTRLWHEEASYGLNRRRIAKSMTFNNRLYVGDAFMPRLHEVRNDVHDDAGGPLVCRIVTPQDSAYPNEIEYNELYVDTLPGQGVIAGAPENVDPTIAVRLSLDNGNTWGNARLLSTGKVGQHKRRVSSPRWGTTKEDGVVWEFQWSSSVARALTGAAVDSQAVRA